MLKSYSVHFRPVGGNSSSFSFENVPVVSVPVNGCGHAANVSVEIQSSNILQTPFVPLQSRPESRSRVTAGFHYFSNEDHVTSASKCSELLAATATVPSVKLSSLSLSSTHLSLSDSTSFTSSNAHSSAETVSCKSSVAAPANNYGSKRRCIEGPSSETNIISPRCIKTRLPFRFSRCSSNLRPGAHSEKSCKKSASASDRRITLRSAARSNVLPSTATSLGKKSSLVSERRTSARVAACSTMPALAIHLMSAPVKKSSPVRASRVGTVAQTKNRSRSVAANELVAFYARKTCVVCSQRDYQPKADVSNKRGARKTNVTWLCCGFCDDAFHSTCLPKNSDIESDDEWICPTCSVDSDLKRRSLAARPRPGNVDSTRPSRSFSSAWLKSCSRVAFASSSNCDSNSNAENILLQPPQSLGAAYSIHVRSYVQSASLLTGLNVSVIAKADLKLPRFADRDESQRADARRKLALAMKDKGMLFDDNLSYPWPDCSQVCFAWRFYSL
jgi:hypothetical protein